MQHESNVQFLQPTQPNVTKPNPSYPYAYETHLPYPISEQPKAHKHIRFDYVSQFLPHGVWTPTYPKRT